MFDNELLADLRVRKGLTQQQVADLLGVAVFTVCRWENSKKIPSRKHIKRLAEIFKVSIKHFNKK